MYTVVFVFNTVNKLLHNCPLLSHMWGLPLYIRIMILTLMHS